MRLTSPTSELAVMTKRDSVGAPFDLFPVLGCPTTKAFAESRESFVVISVEFYQAVNSMCSLLRREFWMQTPGI